MSNKVIIAGSGISGLSAAAYLVQQGFNVEVFEKNDAPGGRLRQFSSDGFTFNMGPSWYWFPEIIQSFFKNFGQNIADVVQLERLDPLFRVDYNSNSSLTIPADKKTLIEYFNTLEKGSGNKLQHYLKKAEKKYNALHDEIEYFSSQHSISNFYFQKIFNSHARYVRSLFKDKRLAKLLEYPIPYMGLIPIRHPMVAFSINYSLYEQGLYYPKGGMYQLIDALMNILDKYEVPIHLSSPVESFDIIEGKISGIITHGKSLHADYFVAATDYHHAEHLIPKEYRNYPEERWNEPSQSPMALVFYLGLDKQLKDLPPNTIHLETPDLNKKKSFSPVCFISCPSKLNPSLAPKGNETLIVRITIPKDIEDTGKMREHYYQKTIDVLEHTVGENIAKHIVYKRTYASTDFANDYNTHMGSPFGWSGTLAKLNERNKKMQNQQLHNLFYAEYPSFLGSGIPSAFLSGKAIAEKLTQVHNKYHD